MHPDKAFRRVDRCGNIAFARERGFGTLAINAKAGPLLSHIPFVLDPGGTVVELHLVRSNTIVAALGRPVEAVLAVQGPDGYVSPDWYGIADQVPTWNYVAVHLRGSLERLPQGDLPAMLDRLSAQFEDRLAPKPAWRTAKMPADAIERMLRMIVPCRMQVTSVDGTWKLNQNKAETARLAAAGGVAASGIGAETGALAMLMRDPPRG